MFLEQQDIWRDYSQYTIAKKRVLRDAFLVQAYRISVWIDYLPQAYSRIGMPLLFGRTIVCDRYVFDTVVNDLGSHMEYDAKDIRLSLASIFQLLPEPDIVFLIDLPEEIALGRKDDVPHIEYLRERRELYLLTARLYPMVELDGAEPPEALADQVMAELARRL
jgi:dTMP kinase